MAQEFRDRRDRVEEALAAATLLIRRRLERELARLRRELAPEVERLLAEGRVEDVVRRFRSVAEQLALAHQEAYVLAARGQAAEVTLQLGRPASVDLSLGRVGTELRSERQRIVSGMVGSQRAALLAALRVADLRGLGPAARARVALDSLGLTLRQVLAVDRYRALLERSAAAALRRELRDEDLDPLLEEAREEDEPLAAAQVGRMSEAYRRNSLAFGIVLLAEFEAQQATGLGSREALAQAAEDGLIESEFVRRWATARDERVRPSHRAMHGQERPEGQPFRSGDGNALRFPGDPLAPASDTRRCRCVLVARAGVPAPSAVG